MSFFAMSGAAIRPIAIVGTVTGTVSSADNVTYALGNIDVGDSSSDKNAIIVFSWSDVGTRTISSASVGGVALLEKVVVALSGNEELGSAIWAADISSISGSQAISVTFSTNTRSVGVSGVAVSGLKSLTPASTDTDGVTTGDATLTALSAPGGGFTIACVAGELRANDFTWTNLTERADIQSGGDLDDHRHGASWDIGGRAAQNVVIGVAGGSDMAAVGAGFR